MNADRFTVKTQEAVQAAVSLAAQHRNPQALRAQLTSETGLVYTLLAHAAGRLG